MVCETALIHSLYRARKQCFQNLGEQDSNKASEMSLATAGANFNKPRTSIISGPSNRNVVKWRPRSNDPSAPFRGIQGTTCTENGF